MNNTLGKKLYKSTALPSIKLVALMMILILFLNLYYQTFNDPYFMKLDQEGFKEVMAYHFKYPHELLVWLFTIFLPALYYGFFRGATFYENGLIINKGLPLFNMVTLYKNIEKYEIVGQKHFMSITRSDTQDDYLFTVKDVDRVLAILDQNHIQGKLSPDNDPKSTSAQAKLGFIFLGVGVIFAIIQYSGFIRELFR